MKKIAKFFLIFFASIFSLWVIARLTNIFQYYKAPTNANYPSIKENASLLASSLISPKRLDFIWFHGPTPFGRQLRLLRLCGLPNDLIEIRNGTLFVNADNIDKELKLAHNYIVAKPELEQIKDLLVLNNAYIMAISRDSFSIPLDDEFVIASNVNAKRLIQPKSFKDSAIYSIFSAEWNIDNFGPIKVPEGKYFVLGDNRHNAFDSRFIGFVEQKDYSATVFWKE